MAVEYPELIAGMAKRQVTRATISKSLGITPRALYSKLSGQTDFTLSEAKLIHESFFPDMKMEVLFERAQESA